MMEEGALLIVIGLAILLICRIPNMTIQSFAYGGAFMIFIGLIAMILTYMER